MSELSEQEKELLQRVRSSSQASKDNSPVAKEHKSFIARLLPKKRNKNKLSLIPLAVGLMVLGLLAVFFFNAALTTIETELAPIAYIESLGGSFEGTAEWEALFGGSNDNSIYDFYRAFSDKRWIISGAIFTAFTLLSALTLVVHVARRK